MMDDGREDVVFLRLRSVLAPSIKPELNILALSEGMMAGSTAKAMWLKRRITGDQALSSRQGSGFAS
ncbi:hypothetical protein [Consotaella salsifontis]|uniref:hypothetical protein n=1 Tax=Consotaella salsifontis TaxID=1365950 RepID=UPI000999B315|nr:hypothetical protein [Consotaella salsifontis]